MPVPDPVRATLDVASLYVTKFEDAAQRLDFPRAEAHAKVLLEQALALQVWARTAERLALVAEASR